jgi:hypothetical protein
MTKIKKIEKKKKSKITKYRTHDPYPRQVVSYNSPLNNFLKTTSKQPW